MQIEKIVALASILATLLLASLDAYADKPGIYLGASAGGYRINESDIHDNDHLVKALAGLQFSNWFGIEGQWTDFNRLNNDNSRFDADGKGASAVVSFPFSETSSVFVKAGEFWWKSDSTLGGTIGTHNGHDPFFGAGLKLGFTKNIALRLEYERYDVTNVKFDSASAGLQFNF